MQSRNHRGCGSSLRGLLFRVRGLVREFRRTPLEGAMYGGLPCSGSGGAAVACFRLCLPRTLLERVERVMPARECLTDEEIEFIVNYGHV